VAPSLPETQTFLGTGEGGTKDGERHGTSTRRGRGRRILLRSGPIGLAPARGDPRDEPAVTRRSTRGNRGGSRGQRALTSAWGIHGRIARPAAGGAEGRRMGVGERCRDPYPLLLPCEACWKSINHRILSSRLARPLLAWTGCWFACFVLHKKNPIRPASLRIPVLGVCAVEWIDGSSKFAGFS
jgi:hypothetical protein